MNAKKIAERLRRLAKYEIPSQPFTSRELKGIITDIADELDPPAKPLLADAKVGDLCKRRDGKYVQIIRIDTCHKYPYRYRDNEYCGDERGVTVTGSWICDDNDKRSLDIIATEPLAEVGTAEWAWQMLMLQKPVSHPAEGEFQDTYYTKEGFVRCMAKTGWQLYEEPQPTYKVGDWVEYKKGKHHQVDSVHDGCCYLSYGKGCGCFSALYSDITRKLDPSEVVIRIGCLSGTVTYAISDDCFLLAKVNDPQHRACCIDMSMLDTPTRELVESLLRAQEEQ